MGLIAGWFLIYLGGKSGSKVTAGKCYKLTGFTVKKADDRYNPSDISASIIIKTTPYSHIKKSSAVPVATLPQVP